MNTVTNLLGPLCPPLRLIVTSECNGGCSFCHHEGLTVERPVNMSLNSVRTITKAAKQIGLHKITVSGGEPTLLANLHVLLNDIKCIYPNVYTSLTTNGLNLQKTWKQIEPYLDKVDISIISLNNEICNKFTCVNSNSILQFVSTVKSKNIIFNINTVVIEENIPELTELINKALELEVSITFMTPLSYKKNNNVSYQAINTVINEYEITNIKLSNTPVLEKKLSSKTSLRIKLPSLSSLIEWKKCSTCPERLRCGEYFCAIRVYPNGKISTCRNKESLSVSPGFHEMALLLNSLISDMTGSFDEWTTLLPVNKEKGENAESG